MSTIAAIERYHFDSLVRWTLTLDCGHQANIIQWPGEKKPEVGDSEAGKHVLQCPCERLGKGRKAS